MSPTPAPSPFLGASTYAGFLLAGASTALALGIVCPSYLAIYLVLIHLLDPLPSQAPQYRLRLAIVLGWATVATVPAVVVTI